MSDLFDERYELVGVLGSGGTGTVHRGRDRVLDRPVAVKVLRTGTLDDEVVRARLRAEARLAGSLHHPGIARIYDYGEARAAGPAGETAPYIVMELVDGVPLDAVLRQRHRLPADEVMTIVARVAEALDTAHRAGIVHRDLKPGNLLVTRAGRPVLVDFGIARSRDLEPLTLTGTIIGTVDYISPEQVRGAAATPRSDVYALGMVAYEALTGRRPFHRETQVATALAHLHDEVPPLGDDVPADVAALVVQMVARAPEQRPANAGEVAARAAALAVGASALDDPEAATTAVVLPPLPARTVDSRASVVRALAAPWARSRRTYAGAAAMAVVVAVSFFVSARPHVVRVPDLRGLHASEAVAVLEARDLDDIERRVVDDPAARRGTVLDQSPDPGTQGDEHTTVVLEVASGRGEVDRAALLGSSYVRAARQVVVRGLVPLRARVTRARGAGTVVAVEPEGRLPLGTPVTLTVAVAPTSPTAPTAPGAPTASPSPGAAPAPPPPAAPAPRSPAAPPAPAAPAAPAPSPRPAATGTSSGASGPGPGNGQGAPGDPGRSGSAGKPAQPGKGHRR